MPTEVTAHVCPLPPATWAIESATVSAFRTGRDERAAVGTSVAMEVGTDVAIVGVAVDGVLDAREVATTVGDAIDGIVGTRGTDVGDVPAPGGVAVEGKGDRVAAWIPVADGTGMDEVVAEAATSDAAGEGPDAVEVAAVTVPETVGGGNACAVVAEGAQTNNPVTTKAVSARVRRWRNHDRCMALMVRAIRRRHA